MTARLFIFTFFLLSSSLFSLNVASANEASVNNVYEQQLPRWANVLEQFVNDDGQIDFASLSQDTEDLKAFVAAIGEVSPASNPELFDSQEKILAYHANAYNALAMIGVIERDIPKNFSTLIKRASFFKLKKVVIGGKKTDLYTYENKVIRPIGEARMHFILNCMVKDCPRLPRKPFIANTLEQDLQTAAIEFFNKDKHILIDVEKQILRLSGIMKFYTKDYVASGKKQDLIEYVNQFRENKVPNEYKVKFIKYDWTINKQT